MSKRDEIISTYHCTDPYGEYCSNICTECEKEIAEMLDDFEKETKANAIDFIVEKLIYPLLNEYDIDLWKNICYVELAEKWVEFVNARNGEDNYIIKDLKNWIAEQMQRGE